MNRKIPYDRGLIVIVLALLGFGLIMVFSASTVVSAELYGSQTSIFTRQLLFVVIGLAGLMVGMKIDYHFYERRTVIYSLLMVSLALLVFLLSAPGSGGVQRWIRVGPANFQPSELAKLAVILFTSFYLVTRKEQFQGSKRGLLPYLALVGSIVLLVLIEPDLGTAASIALTAVFLLFLGGLRYRYLLGLILAAIPALYFLVVRIPYRLDRFLAYLDPERDPYGIGYQIRQSLIAVGSGGWSGLGSISNAGNPSAFPASMMGPEEYPPRPTIMEGLNSLIILREESRLPGICRRVTAALNSPTPLNPPMLMV